MHKLLNFGHGEVVDADLSGYFDSIPHAELTAVVARRVSDKAMLHLIKLWLEAPVEETDERGHKRRSDPQQGRGPRHAARVSDQPLLANLYMRRFVLGWKTLGHEKRLQARIVNYADDFVICCRGTPQRPRHDAGDDDEAEVDGERRPRRESASPGGHVRLPGVYVRTVLLDADGTCLSGHMPSKKKVHALCESISEQTSRRYTLLEADEIVARSQPELRGWANYFRLGPVSKAYRAVERHARHEPAPPMVVCEAQAERSGVHALSRSCT